ncbi:MAG: LysM peptidoglycan-binding domain-containing protein [Candidatus Obscuribacterales bacterium]|nr:LysM peptidoglycan-binding domain-containing protein [Candidatus Obscuribacterales bacterium]
MLSEQEKLDFDSVPEYVREPRSSRDSYVSKACYLEDESEPHAKSAEIETLWPGVSADFLHGNAHKKQPSHYWGLGFVSGITATVLLAGLVYGGIQMFSHQGQQGAAQIVVSNGKGVDANHARNGFSTSSGAAVVTTRVATAAGDPETLVPLFSSYTVRTGDTLASIALQAYKRATPRLLDEICRANGMRNANVLSLGQTLNLPQYRPQARQIASGASGIQ